MYYALYFRGGGKFPTDVEERIRSRRDMMVHHATHVKMVVVHTSATFESAHTFFELEELEFYIFRLTDPWEVPTLP